MAAIAVFTAFGRAKKEGKVGNVSRKEERKRKEKKRALQKSLRGSYGEKSFPISF